MDRSRLTLLTSLSALATLTAGCGAGGPLSDPGASPDEIVDAWGSAACGPYDLPGGYDVTPIPTKGSEIAAAACHTDNEGRLVSGSRWIRIYKSPDDMTAAAADLQCYDGMAVSGPTWISQGLKAVDVIALQDLGAKNVC